MRIAPCAPICQSGGILRNVRQRRRQRQGEGADDRTDRRDAAADEIAAPEDDPGDGEEGVAVGDVGLRRRGEADEGEAGEHAQDPGRAEHDDLGG